MRDFHKNMLIFLGFVTTLGISIWIDNKNQTPKDTPLEERVLKTPVRKKLDGYYIPPSSMATLFGTQAFNQGDYQTAEKIYRRGIELNPENMTNYEGLGTILLNQKKYDEAEPIFRNILKKDQQNLIAFMGLGSIGFHRGNYQEGKRYLQRAEQAVQSIPIHTQEGKDFAAQSFYAIAGLYYQLTGSFHHKFQDTGDESFKQQREFYLARAFSNLDRALKIKPDHAQARKMLEKIEPLRIR